MPSGFAQWYRDTLAEENVCPVCQNPMEYHCQECFTCPGTGHDTECGT